MWTLTVDPLRRRALHELPADPGPAGYPDPAGDRADYDCDQDDDYPEVDDEDVDTEDDLGNAA